MIHYSCDRCGRRINVQEETRYVVKVEIEGVLEPLATALDEGDDERDHLLELHEGLERAAELDDFLADATVYERQRFDLCTECHRKYVKNPLGREASNKQLDFSQN